MCKADKRRKENNIDPVTITPLVFTTSCYELHFTDEETDTQSSYVFTRGESGSESAEVKLLQDDVTKAILLGFETECILVETVFEQL